VAAGLPVSRFARLAGIPRRTYHRRLARLRDGEPVKGPWPTPSVDEIEAIAAKYAEALPAWGHRKIAALMRRRVFRDPPTERNRVISGLYRGLGFEPLSEAHGSEQGGQWHLATNGYTTRPTFIRRRSTQGE